MSTPFLLPQIIERAAQRDGQRPAVRCEGVELTYDALDVAVRRLAWTLADIGVARGDRVGVLLHKSVESMVAVHGVMAAGAAYVPLDPLAPPAHLATVIEDCGITTIITDDRSGGRRLEQAAAAAPTLQKIVGAEEPIGDLSLIPPAQIEAADQRPLPRVTADDLAYVMYTSGSTGRPKGIMHTHRSGLRYAELAADAYDLRPEDRLANIAPLHFDQSTFEYFSAPLVGACAVLVPTPVVRLPASLGKLLADEDISIWYSVPSILVQLLKRGGLAELDLSALRWVLFGGEVFPPAALRELMGLWPNARFSNVYGPAEVNQCTYFHLDAPPVNDDPIPIGQAWDDTEILVVDDELEPVTPGESGQVIVRTSTMMQGYWNRPDLTAAGIFERQIGGLPTRWYATGDLASALPSGDLVFEGRADRQVKVRGNRVELEAVEAALSGLVQVGQSAVTVAEFDGQAEIVAAVVPLTDTEPLDARTLQRQLGATIPTYAVPTRITVVSALPTTGSGKIDTNAIASLARDQ